MDKQRPNRAGNSNVPQLDYSRWHNRICGYGFCVYEVAVGIVFGFIGSVLDDPPNPSTAICRDLIDDAKKDWGDIAAEKGLTPLSARANHLGRCREL